MQTLKKCYPPKQFFPAMSLVTGNVWGDINDNQLTAEFGIFVQNSQAPLLWISMVFVLERTWNINRIIQISLYEKETASAY